MNPSRTFHRFASAVTKAAGSPIAFIAACLLIIVWALSGPVFHFSDTWQLVINTGTTIITFLMVFIIQYSSNKDQNALQKKLDALIAAIGEADNKFIGIEKLTDKELQELSEPLKE